MKVMLDLNILLDHIQKREPHYQFSSIVISEVLKNKVEGIIPAHALTTLYYLISKYTNKERANERIDWLLEKFDFVGGDKSLFKRARNLQIDDFEDAVVASLAEDLHLIILLAETFLILKIPQFPQLHLKNLPERMSMLNKVDFGGGIRTPEEVKKQI